MSGAPEPDDEGQVEEGPRLGRGGWLEARKQFGPTEGRRRVRERQQGDDMGPGGRLFGKTYRQRKQHDDDEPQRRNR